jgi:hypothetical protein
MDPIQILFAVSLGIGLAAASGFRVFIPLFAMSLGQAAGAFDLGTSMQWVGSPLALVILGSATALEIGAYYIPWVDNLLDSIASPAAVVAGTLVAAGAASQITHIDPAVQWVFGIVAGGGTAGVVQASTVATRAASTLVSGGLANPAVSTVEAGAATTLSILSIIVPPLAVALLIALLVFAIRRWTRRRDVATTPQPASVPSL